MPVDFGTVSILEAEPDLASGVDASELDRAANAAWARTGVLRPGSRGPAVASPGQPLGVLLLSGLMTRRMQVAGRGSIELLGAGDLLPPWQLAEIRYASVRVNTRWRVIEPTWIALLDSDFPRRVARWPTITRNLESFTFPDLAPTRATRPGCWESWNGAESP